MIKIIKNESLYITDEQIEQCIAILNNKYKVMECNVFLTHPSFIEENGVFGNSKTEIYRLGHYYFDGLRDVFNRKLLKINKSDIYIYLDAIKKVNKTIDGYKIDVIGSLFHEIFHSYQVFTNQESDKDKCEDEACKFAIKNMMRLRKKINKILNIESPNWIYYGKGEIIFKNKWCDFFKRRKLNKHQVNY